MVDSGRCRVPYDDNEEEFSEFYEYEEEQQVGRAWGVEVG